MRTTPRYPLFRRRRRDRNLNLMDQGVEVPLVSGAGGTDFLGCLLAIAIAGDAVGEGGGDGTDGLEEVVVGLADQVRDLRLPGIEAGDVRIIFAGDGKVVARPSRQVGDAIAAAHPAVEGVGEKRVEVIEGTFEESVVAETGATFQSALRQQALFDLRLGIGEHLTERDGRGSVAADPFEKVDVREDGWVSAAGVE